MKILAPVSNVESARLFIKSGAEEVYLGADDELFSQMSMTGRGKSAYDGRQILCSFKELKEIVKVCKESNTTVNFLCNFPFINDEIFKGKKFIDHAVNYIERGIDAGVDAIVVGDIGLLNYLKEREYNIEVHASVFLKTLNVYQVEFFKKLNVKRIVTSYHITIDDIRAIKEKTNIDIETIGYLGCSFYNGMCSFKHDIGERYDADFIPGVTCKNTYRVKKNGIEMNDNILDVESGCSICSLKKLEEAGVDSLKIVGRDRNPEYIAKVISLYKESLEKLRNEVEPKTLQENLPYWWKRQWCRANKCKFIDRNSDLKYMIGR
ncbi:peptidase U32 family protein [Abyssisolibacter fermentans]|uniref:peptidase U32 family protein n=1 Tax=Abyssisolibacter fermentans TaxID=1766203 RepID=UPI000829B43A|nr:peptidase U32 family protein [Abyssisolibacter fermentans]